MTEQADTGRTGQGPTARERLLSLIEFAQQAARLKVKPAAAIDEKLFTRYEHDVRGLPGVRLNATDTESDDEIWLAVQRLHETRAPEIKHATLTPWVLVTEDPNGEPTLREAIRRSEVIDENGVVDASESSEEHGTTADEEEMVALASFERSAEVHAQFTDYLERQWRPWAEDEKLRRRTIRMYSELFTLKQQLEGAIAETQLELVWGAGVGIWNHQGTRVRYPIVTRLVEVSINDKTAELEVRPRDVDMCVELDWYASVENPGVSYVEKAAKDLLASPDAETFSPFDRGTFEPLLLSAVTHLGDNGIYWPREHPDDRTLPAGDERLKVTDSWALFARPRTNNLLILDLERLKKRVEDAESYPPAITAVVTDPSDANPVIELPAFRGVSGSYQEDATDGGKARDLYFPKPFNEEQVRIVQWLDVSDGVVVQGPPGTGKTHTIANVICHYLAEGKRVLVTSMKDPALSVLQGQLPDEIRSLAISLLTSERDGMKQFEHAVERIQAGVQGLDRPGTAREISQLDETIDILHARIALVDRQIRQMGEQNLRNIEIDGATIDPQKAALELVQSRDQAGYIPDELGTGPAFKPQFSDGDIAELRSARRALGADIDYVSASLPILSEFPEPTTLLEVHQDLSRFQELQQSVDSGEVPELRDTADETLNLAGRLVADIDELRERRLEIAGARRAWTGAMHERIRRLADDELLQVLEDLGNELGGAVALRRAFLERPVTTPEGGEHDVDLIEAVANLAKGKGPFGLTGLFGKGAVRKQLQAIRVLGSSPASSGDWAHVHAYLGHLGNLTALAMRWNVLISELPLEAVSSEPAGGLAAAEEFSVYRTIKVLVNAERDLRTGATELFPSWPGAREVAESDDCLAELETALHIHLTRSRLVNTWARREEIQRALDGRSGRIVDELRRFLSGSLGNPDVPDARMQSDWSALMSELSRVLVLSEQIDVVRNICSKVEASGAPQYSLRLKQEAAGAVDDLLPNNWQEVWRLRRLRTHLESIDAHNDLVNLSKERRELERSLSRAYEDVVVRRTWLKLAENSSPRIRAALKAYVAAVGQFGKTGKGKKAILARAHARAAAEEAVSAVPCWIMPHYRVSESLPAELGCFNLVVIDEASQSDFTALPALLRAEKVLVVGDHRQVSPEAVGLDIEKVETLMKRLLDNQVGLYRPLMSPARSIYDLFQVVFAKSDLMLKEHFRCVAPIIEYSKRSFYNHELRPLRIPKPSERLDPPLIDVLVEDGFRKGNVNPPEARFIVDEIRSISADPAMHGRSIGVVSLIGDEQARLVWELLTDELGTELVDRHRIRCGDARTFQGNERDIMFLSMVAAPNYNNGVLSGTMYDQRFNVAASRARDRMYLVRSMSPDQLSEGDELRRNLIEHFSHPFAKDEKRVDDLRTLCESDFEREMYDELAQRGYWVTPQVRAGHKRIDLVVEGRTDSRLAIECDGDQYHGPDRWASDMERQRALERAGWVFWRCFASAFIRRRQEVLGDLFETLKARGIEPIGAEGAPRSVHTEFRPVSAMADTDRETTVDVGDVQSSGEAEPSRGTNSDEGLGSPIQNHEQGTISETVPTNAIPTATAGEPEPPIEQGTPTATHATAETDVDEVTRVEPRTAALLRAAREHVAETKTTSATQNGADVEQAVAYASEHGLRTVDRRSIGGALWIVGGREHAETLKPLGFDFAASGGRASGHQPAWYLRELR